MRKTPLEEKIEAMASSFEKLVDLLLKIPDNFDRTLSQLSDKIDHLEDKIIHLSLQVTSKKAHEIPVVNTEVKPPPPSPNPSASQIRATNTQVNPRVALMAELKKKMEKMNKGRNI